MHPTQQTNFDQLASDYLGESESSFDQLANEYLQQSEFDQFADDYLGSKQENIDPLRPDEGQEQVSSDSYIDKTFAKDDTVEGQIVSMFMSGAIDLKHIPDDLALKASEWAANKAEEIDKIKVTPELKHPYEVAPFDSMYVEGGKKPPMNYDTRLQLKTAFEEASKYLKLDPQYAQAYDTFSEQYADLAQSSWEQHDKWQNDSDNNEFPELFKYGVGEAQIVPQDMLRAFADGIPLSMVQFAAELKEEADPVIRGSEEANTLTTKEKQFRGRYGAYVPMWQFMGGFKRPYPKEDKRFYETLSEVGGTLMQFTKFGSGNLAWQGGQKGMGKIMSTIRSKTPSTTRIPPPKYGNPFKAGVQRAKDRMINTAAGATGYELAYQETGNAGAERLDESYFQNKITKELQAAAVNIPAMVALGEGIHHGAKGLRPIFYRTDKNFQKKFGTAEAFKAEYNKINDLVASGKGTATDANFLAYVKVQAERMGIPMEFIATGRNGFKLQALSPRAWTEKLPALRSMLANQIVIARKAKAPKQEKVVEKAEAQVKDPTPPKSDIEKLAIETAETTKGIANPPAIPPKPKDKVDPGLSFVSGLERSPTDAANAIAGGGQIGVRLNEPLSKSMVSKVVDLTQLNQNVFLEHGLYTGGGMDEAYGDSFTDLIDRLDELVQAGAKPENLYVILPDALDSAALTRDYTDLAYSAIKRRDALQDVNYIYVMQRERSGGKFTEASVPADMVENVTIGIPGNLSRVNVPELRSLFTTGLLKPYNKFHLLGVDPASQRGKELIEVIREQMPEAIISADTALGRTSVNAVKKENMEVAAQNLGLVDDIPEHENWTDWVDEIYSTVPQQAGWTPNEVSEVARAVAYDDKEFLEIFKLLNENKTLYEIEEILGYEIGGPGQIDRYAFQKLLETIFPKTNRGEWIKKKAEEASTPVEPTAPVDQDPEDEDYDFEGLETPITKLDEDEVEQEPIDPNVTIVEPESPVDPETGLTGSVAVKKVKGLHKEYEINENDVIINEDVEVIWDEGDFKLSANYALFDEGVFFNVDFSTNISARSGPISYNKKLIYEGGDLEYIKQETIKIGLAYAEEVLKSDDKYSQKVKKSAEKFIEKFGDNTLPKRSEVNIDELTAKIQSIFEMQKGEATTTDFDGINRFGANFDQLINDAEFTYLLDVTRLVEENTTESLMYLRDAGTEKDLKGKYVKSIRALRSILHRIKTGSLEPIAEQPDPVTKQPKIINRLNRETEEKLKKEAVQYRNNLARLIDSAIPSPTKIKNNDLWRIKFDRFFNFLNHFNNYAIHKKDVISRDERKAQQFVKENKNPTKTPELQAFLEQKDEWKNGGRYPDWLKELRELNFDYEMGIERFENATPEIEVKPPSEEEKTEPDEIFANMQKKIEDELDRIRSGETPMSEKADDFIIKQQRKYIVDKLKSIKNTYDDPYEALSKEDLKEYKRLEKRYEEAKRDPKTKEEGMLHDLQKFRTKLLNAGSLPYIELKVPYDGIIRLINGKKEIEAFKKNIGKNAINFRKATSPTGAKAPKALKPTPYPRGKGDLAKAGNYFVSTNLERYMLKNVVQLHNGNKLPYETIAATDGRRLIFIKNQKTGKLPSGVVALDEKNILQNKEGGKYPPLHHVVPKGVLNSDKDFFSFTDKYFKPDLNWQLDSATLHTWATSLNLMSRNKTDAGMNIGMQLGTDGKISMYTYHNDASFEYSSPNAPVKRKPDVVINSKFLADIAKAVAELKLGVIEFRPDGRNAPLIVMMRPGIKGDPAAWLVQMPIRTEEPSSPYGVRDVINPRNLKLKARAAIRQNRYRHTLNKLKKLAPASPSIARAIAANKDHMIGNVKPHTLLTEEQIEFCIESFVHWWITERDGNYENIRYHFVRWFPQLSEAYLDLVQRDLDAELKGLRDIQKAKDSTRDIEQLLTGGLIASIDPVKTTSLIGKAMPDPSNIEEFIKHAQVLRSPNLEYAHVVGVKDGIIQEVQTTTLNSPHAANIDPKAVKEFNTKYDEFYIVHNHPSGDPSPSVTDDKMHEGMKYKSNYVGSIVLDHGEYAFAKRSDNTHHYGIIKDIAIQQDMFHITKEYNPISGYKMNETEHAIHYINQFMQKFDGDLSNANGNGYFVFYLDRKNIIRGVTKEIIDDGTRSDPSSFIGKIRLKAQAIGSSQIILYEPPAKTKEQADQQILNDSVIFDAAQNTLDVIKEGSEWRDGFNIANGNDLGFGNNDLISVEQKQGQYGEKPIQAIGGRRSEPVESCFDYIDRNGNVVKQKFNLEAIPPIRFPELVKLYVAIKGEFPKLKKSRDSLGYVAPYGRKDWFMAINPNTFKMSNDQAAMTFAHEMGHVFDYMDDFNIKRGNILGRIASANDNKDKQLPAFMGAPVTDFTMTPQERRKIRSNAEKQITEEIYKEWLEIAEAKQLDPFKNMKRQTGWKDAYAEYLAPINQQDVPVARDALNKRIKKESKPRYHQLLAQTMGEGGMLDEKLIRAELLDLMDWWKPIEGDPSYIAYRQSSVELYADTLSVLFCAPHELQERAPMFWQSFFSYLPTKPSLEAKIRKVWDFIRTNQASGVLRNRLEEQRKRWKLQEQIVYEDSLQRKAVTSARQFWSKLQVDHYDYAYGVQKRVKKAKEQGATFDWSEDPEMLWGVHPFSNNKPYIWVSKVYREIVGGLNDYALTLEDFGQYLMFTRIIHETNRMGTGRSQIANEYGTTPTEARRNLLSMMGELGSDKIAILDLHAKKFRRMFFEIYEDLYKEGMFTARTWHDHILPNKDSYATFAVAEYFMDRPYVPAGIKKQVGSFKPGMNPFPIMVMKALAALRLLEKHRAQTATVRLMESYFPNEIRELDYKMVFDRNILARKKVYNDSVRSEINRSKWKEGTITLVRNGELFEYVVPWDVAQAHKGVDPMFDGVIGIFGNLTFRKFFYPLFITYNPGFQWILSPMRDFNRTWVNLPNKVSRLQLLKAYKKLWRTSWGRIKGELSPIVQEMMEVGAIGTPFDNYSQNVYEDESGIFKMILERYKLAPKNEKGLYAKLEKFLKPLEWMGGKILQIGQTFETLAKTAPYYILTRELGIKPEEAGEFVRNYSGVPPYWRRGKVAYMSGALMPFINVAMKGYMMDFKLMSGQVKGMGTTDRKRFLGLGPLSGGSGGGGKLPPRFPGGSEQMPNYGGRPGGNRSDRQTNAGVTASWWLKYMRSSGMWTMLKVGGLVGLFGAAVKKAMEMIPSYDQDNYHCIPMGYVYVDSEGIDRFINVFTDDIPIGAKVVYFRIPMDETQKMISKFHSAFLFEVAQQMEGEEVYPTKGLEGLSDFVQKQMPGLHPLLEIGPAWKEYIGGGNPKDSFTGRDILSYDENLVRGKHGLQKMFLWTYDQSGLGNFVGVDPETDTTLEYGLKTWGKQTIGRLIKVSDSGRYETGYEIDRTQDIRYAQLKLSYGENTHKMIKEYNRISGVRADNRKFIMTDREYEVLSDWYSEYSVYHDDAKSCLDHIDDPAVKDKKFWKSKLQTLRTNLEEYSKLFIEAKMN